VREEFNEKSFTFINEWRWMHAGEIMQKSSIVESVLNEIEFDSCGCPDPLFLLPLRETKQMHICIVGGV
jgi:hypothetical protein